MWLSQVGALKKELPLGGTGSKQAVPGLLQPSRNWLPGFMLSLIKGRNAGLRVSKAVFCSLGTGV